MASPNILVNGVSSVGGTTITGGDVVTIQLADLAGVNSWVLNCFAISDPYVIYDINSLFSRNETTKTITFTSPVDIEGYTFLIESIINGQQDTLNGQFRAEWRTTAGIAALTVFGRRVLAPNEGAEFSTDYGWTPALNDLLRNASVPSGLAGLGLYSSAGVVNVGATDASIAISADSIAVGILQNDTQHGVRGGGTQHSVATTSVAGFMSAADKTKLDASTNAATISTLVQRSSTGEFKAGNGASYFSLDPTNSKIESSIGFSLKTVDTSMSSSATLTLKSGDVSMSGASGGWTLKSGDVTAVGGASGLGWIETGSCSLGNTGSLITRTGVSGTGISGSRVDSTGAANTQSGSHTRSTGGAAISGDINDQTGNGTTTGSIKKIIGTGTTRGNLVFISEPPVAPTTDAQACIYLGPSKTVPVVPNTGVPSTSFQGAYLYIVPVGAPASINGIAVVAGDVLIITKTGTKKISA